MPDARRPGRLFASPGGARWEAITRLHLSDSAGTSACAIVRPCRIRRSRQQRSCVMPWPRSKRRSSGMRYLSTRSRRSSLARLDPPVVSGHLVQARFGCGSGCSVVEIILSEHQLARLKAAVPKGSVEHAALEAGDYFAGDEIAPEPVAVTFTCSLQLAKQLLAIARTACPDVAAGIRAAINQQTR
jgi:hypothetical protein